MKHTQPLKPYGVILIISIALATAALSGCAAKTPSSESQQVPLVLIDKIEPRDADGKTEITITGTEPILQSTSFQLSEPLRLVVDITDANIAKFTEKMTVGSGGITDITPSQKDNIARLEIGLSQAVETKVYQSGGTVVVEIMKPADVAKSAPEPAPAAEAPKPEAAPAPAPEPVKAETPPTAPEAAPAPAVNPASVVTAVKASAGKKGVNVVITGDGEMKPNAFMVGKNKLVIDIPGVRSKVKPSVIPVRKGGLDRVRVGQHKAPDLKVRIVMDLTKSMPYSVTPDGNTLRVAMGEGVAAAAPAAPMVAKAEEALPQERAAAKEPEKPAVEKEVTAPAPQEPAAAEPVPAPAPVAAREQAPPKREISPNENALLTGSSKYRGKKMSLDFQDADLISIMRLFAEVANLNIILAPDVKGKVTVRMVEIPWDQAMDIILKMNGLGYTLEDNILRIASVSALTKEAEEDMKAKEAKKKAEDLIARIIPINYAKASEVEGTIKKSLSSRGETVTDTRTNTLIVRDIARNVDEIVSLIKLLDKPIPQVMIEARIVEASLNFSRTVGVQWGGSVKAGAAYGNPTGLSFPNSINVTGGPQMGAPASGSGNYFVNMPAPAGAGAGGGAIGFTFGSISRSLNLDLILSALESTGEGKVISTPRVSALDNKEAKIEQGVSVPYATSSASGGTNIQFIDAKLSLEVTPHATPDNKIFMKIKATKNAPDVSQIFNGQPSIRKNEANTEILLADGETAVIGGILVYDRGQSYTKVPFFGDLPLIGWLFRNKSNREEKRELIIFITPRIVRQEVI